MQGVQAHVQLGVILVHQAYCLLLPTVIIYFCQSPEPSDSMIYMNHVITGMQVLQFTDRDRFPSLAYLGGLQTIFLVTVENLVFRVHAYLDIGITKSLVYRTVHRDKINRIPFIREYIPQSLQLHVIR